MALRLPDNEPDLTCPCYTVGTDQGRAPQSELQIALRALLVRRLQLDSPVRKKLQGLPDVLNFKSPVNRSLTN